jgi:hypothetical protein
MPAPPLYDKGPKDGLHVLKDTWKQKLYLGEQSNCLSESLDEAIEATFNAAPTRTQGYAYSGPKKLDHDFESNPW